MIFQRLFWIFSVCAPSLLGAYQLQTPDARAIFLHNALLSIDTCSVTGGPKTYGGGTNGKGMMILKQICENVLANGIDDIKLFFIEDGSFLDKN